MESALLLLAGALVGWLVDHFAPGVWRAVTRRPLLRIYVETDPAIIHAGDPPWIRASYLVEDVRGLDAPPSEFCPDWFKWLEQRGAIHADTMEVEVTLIAESDMTVVIDAIRAKIVSRASPPAWRQLICAVGGADITPRHVRIELDDFSVPTTTWQDQEGRTLRSQRLSLSKGESEKLLLIAHARIADIHWTAELLTLLDGDRRIFKITSGGRPFRTCGSAGLPAHEWLGSEWHPPLYN